MPITKPEERAREQIDRMLTAAGWTLQNYKAADLSASRGIALREVPLKTGPCDYLLLVDRKPVGVVEAKKVGTTLSGVAAQSETYGKNLPDFLADLLPGTKSVPFLYESTGVETFFRDERDPSPRSRRVFSFHRPETLASWIQGSAGVPPAVSGVSPDTSGALPLRANLCRQAMAGSGKRQRHRPPRRRRARRAGACARQYNHERAVADGVNVGYEVYRIKTQVTEQGGKVEKGFYVDRRSKETRAVRWERLDEDLTYANTDLDRSVVVTSQIRTVLTAFRDALCTVPRPLRPTTIRRRRTRSVGAADTLFPGRTLVPKTLIFCKDDSHAEDTVHLVREVFGRGNDFAKKITYKAYNPETKRYEKSETLIQVPRPSRPTAIRRRRTRRGGAADTFRTSPTLRIAVTVDMIATGTDIKPLEVLIFLRDVRSRTYFEQMKGRGTRVLTPTDLQAVSGADARAKTHFVIVDAVGVCDGVRQHGDGVVKRSGTARRHRLRARRAGCPFGRRRSQSDKTDSRPLERQRTVAFDKLLLGVALGKRDEDTLTTLAGRLTRLERELTTESTEKLKSLSGGKSLGEMAQDLLNAVDPDFIAAEVQKSKFGNSPPAGVLPEPSPSELSALRASVVQKVCLPFDNPILRDALAKAKQDAEQTIDVTTEDVVLSSGFDAAAKAKAAGLVQAFRDYIEQHHAEITALQILYGRPYAQRLTEPMLKDLEKKLRENHAAWTEDRLWDAFAAAHPDRVKGRSQPGRFADLVALVRFSLEQQPVLEPFAESVHSRFDAWLRAKDAAAAAQTSSPLERGDAQRRSVPTDNAEPGSTAFSSEQLSWLCLIRDHIATTCSIETDDFGFSPFSQRGGLGRAHQLFGDELGSILTELNDTLAA